MKAVVQERFGAPEAAMRLAEIDRPVPGPGHVLVRMRATSVNTPDWIAVTGVPYLLRLQTGLRPAGAVRGTDVAGTVAEVGPGVEGFAVGDAVFGSLWDGAMPTAGAFAEYAAVRADRLAPLPEGVGFADAAASVMSGLTALIAVREVAQIKPGGRILINGASGGVGTFAVQIAAHEGAEVTAVCGPSNVDLVRDLGAERVIDYSREDFTAGPDRFDAVLDNVLNHRPRRTARVLADGGVLMPNSVGNTGGLTAGLGRMIGATILGRLGRARVRFVQAEYDRERLGAVAELLASGAVRPVIDSVHSLEETPKAVARMFSHRARGNIVITMGD